MTTIRITGHPDVHAVVTDGPEVTLTLRGNAVDDLHMLLNRALNTMDPNKIPPWAMDVSDALNAINCGIILTN